MTESLQRDLTRRLRDAGLRVTAPRLAVLAALSETSLHPEAEAVKAAASQRIGSISTQAVYDALDTFVQAGLARRIRSGGSAARYEARVGDNHHHLVCRTCGHTVDIDCVVGVAPCLGLPATNGFVIDEAEIIFWGRCPACVAATSVSSGG
jgi:Fur family ferric uptake transcriptional regulator